MSAGVITNAAFFGPVAKPLEVGAVGVKSVYDAVRRAPLFGPAAASF